MKNLFIAIRCLSMALLPLSVFSQMITTRPMIWVKPSDKPAILEKIAQNQWAKDYYEAFKNRVGEELKNHQANPKDYLSKMPLDWSKKQDEQVPPVIQLKGFGGVNAEKREALIRYLQTAVDCGVLYYLTDDEKYAQISADILYTMIEGLVQVQPNDKGHNGGGYLYPDDHLREAREIGAQLPIIYDFVASFLSKGGLVFNVATQQKTTFSVQRAEKVFKTYIKLALEHGIIDCNWSVLESSSLVGNTLALDDEKERKKFLEYYLTKNTPNQDALQKVANHYLDHQGYWPESLGYSSAVASLSTYLMTLLTRYDPKLDLGNKYPHIPLALTTPYYLTYPNNNQTVLFGDGHRSYHADYESFETAYYLGEMSKNQQLISEFGALLNSGIYAKKYDRTHLGKRNLGAEVYREPIHLLWYMPVVEGEVKDYPLPVSDELPFAGITLQRNLSVTNNPKDALMGFVGGGAHVHGHASGMSMELYGKGYVLGPKAGRGTYTTDLHENYYRIFASHNTVVVNGASESAGGWAGLGINRVEQVALEPNIKQKPVSSAYSFATSRFTDDKGDQAEATQERTLAIVRTSPTTGYYIDVFRSKSALPNQYHDYIYRNLADELKVESEGKPLNFEVDSLRYKASSTKKWVQNKTFKHPGWHFFKEVQTAENKVARGVEATFIANKLAQEPIKMKLFVSYQSNQAFTKAMSPMSNEAPKSYSGKDNPTLVIRKKGEAWGEPFAVIYEPFEGNQANGSIQTVETIAQKGEFKGLKISSNLKGKTIIQYAFILESPDAIYADTKLGITFKGRYAVATLDEKEQLKSVYIGEGQSFSYKKIKVNPKNGTTAAFFSFP
ncbi:MAG: heparinase II/III family protein [Spirosomataceae bacterium]